jgi:hypothetical protein
MGALTLAALFTVLAVALLMWCIWALLQPSIKRQQSHSPSLRQPPSPSSSSAPPRIEPPPARPEALASPAPSLVHALQADVTYTKADGSTSVRRLTLYSYNRQNEIPYSLNARQEGQQLTKQFLIERISKLVLVDDPSVSITAVEELRAWIPRRIREKGEAPVRQRSMVEPVAPPAQVCCLLGPKALRCSTLKPLAPPTAQGLWRSPW